MKAADSPTKAQTQPQSGKKYYFPQCNLRQVVNKEGKQDGHLCLGLPPRDINLGRGGKCSLKVKGTRSKCHFPSPLPDSQPCCKAVPRQPCLGKVPALCNLHFYSSRPRAVNTKCSQCFLLCLLKFQGNIRGEHRYEVWLDHALFPVPLTLQLQLVLMVINHHLPIHYSLIH